MGGPQLLSTSSTSDIALAFVSTPLPRSQWSPMVACNQDKLMVLGFGGEYIDIYQSNWPVHKMSDFNAKLWTSPVFRVLSFYLVYGSWLWRIQWCNWDQV